MVASRLLNCSKIGHSCEAFIYQFGRNISTHLLTANKIYLADLMKSGVTGNLGMAEFLLTSSIVKYKVIEFSLRDLRRGSVKVSILSPRISVIPRLPVISF